MGKSKAVFNVVVVLILLNSTTVFSQLAVPFTPRLSGGNIKVKGDVVLIGNSVVSGKGLALPYTGGGNNNSYEAVYIDVDGDTDTFSSSTADLKINNSCKNIVFAGLYWASCYPNEVGTDVTKFFQGTPRLNDWNQVKFKLPTGAYVDLVADNNPDLVGEEDNIIFDGYQYYGTSAPADAQSFKDSPIICYKNVTNLLKGLTDADGTYTVANLRATRGLRQGGSGGGWTLVVIYESPTVPSKFISVFDGYAGVQGGATLDIPVSGYRTLPSPLPVNAKIGVAALEGDRGISDDRFQFKASSSAVFTNISDAVNPANNFFNSTISNNGVNVIDRNPASTNTLGFDVDNVIIPNPSRSVIPNNSTAGDLKLTTSGDGYGAFVTTFAVDIIEPTILLTKIVKDDAGNDASNLDVTLGQSLNYTIGFENQGNDDATSFTIKDILPINVNFNYPADIVSVPAGVTHTYNAATRTIIFTIPNNLVQKTLVPGGPFVHYDIVLKVKVVPTCNELSDACENRIQNTAYATYRGVINTAQITDDPSLSSYTSCNLGTPQATNFLVGVKDCLFTNKAVLCGNSSTVTASNGYASYTWTGPGNFTATGQTVTVTVPGVYKVFGVGNKPCTDYNEEITVERFGGIAINPVSAFADEEVTCPNDGKILPNIFLCGTNSIGSSGANSSRLINTNISDGSTIVWERLNEASCSAVANSNCANESSSCTWSNVGSGPSYLANTSGQFRVTFNYPGGCFNRFYFNVYQNLLSPTVTTSDIVCSTSGRITIGGVPAGYEYSLDGVTYQSSNVFSVNTANSYTAYIRQVGVTSSPCIFTVPDILIRERAFTVDVSNTNPLCYGGKGTVQLVANDVNPQYYFSIYQGATLVNSVGPIASNVHTFTDLNSGVYTVNVSTNPSTDNCAFTGSVTIVDPPVLTATAALTTPLTCSDGEITVTPVGGTAPYFYFVNSATVFQTVPEIAVTLPLPAGGIYNIDVVDSNNCTYKIPPLIVTPLAKPVFTVAPTNVLCYGANTGVIQFNVTNANGYTLAYSIDNGVTYVANGTFSNLVAGTYTPILRYSLNGVDCFDPQPAITITEPASAVTASAGVSELAGCGIAPTPKNYGKVRITNPQGGVSPYEYSFDNQATWTTTNDAFKAPGTYNLYVRDANGCIFSAPITLDPEPVEPQIDVATPVDFNCDGTATSTVTVANPGGVTYTYDYYLDGVKNTNTPNNVFLNVAPGTHAIKVEYKLNSVPTFSNLLNENFGTGNSTTAPGIAAAYCFNDLRVSAPYLCGTRSVEDNQYSVTYDFWRSDDPSGTNVGAWYHFKDHTTNPNNLAGVGDPRGRFLLVNIGSAAGPNGVLYSKPIIDVIPNQPVKVDFAVANLLRAGINGAAPDILVQLVDGSGTVVAQQYSGKIAELPGDANRNKWVPISLTLNPGNNTNLRFVIRSGSILYSGNDVVIDDVRVYQLPKSCLSTKDFTIIVPTGNAFSAQIAGTKNVTCAGANNGEITIAAQNFEAAGFQYSKDNGVTWQTATSSPVIITGLAGALYKVIVRPDASSAASCSKPFDVTINTPAAVTASASITVQATCTTGATITAVGGGGTPAYQYELRQSNGTTVITAFNNNANFTNVPAGSYTVFVRDANGCSNATGYSITVTAPPALTATLDTTTDYCYTTANPATLVVGLTGGVGPFTYKLNSNAAVSSALTTFSFANVAPGTHTIVVTDSNNCTATISSIVIAPQIGFNVSLLNDLTCLVDASIGNPNVTNGNGAPYTYTVSHNGGTPTTVAAFPFTATLSGTYVFTVTDSRGCPAASNTITVTAKTTPAITTTKTDITCNNANDGSITVTASGGFTTSYTYAIKLSASATYTTQTSNQFTALPAGTYNVKVIDSKGCESAVSNVTIVNPGVVTGNISATDIGCSPTGTVPAVVTVTGSGGTGTLQYSFNGNSNFTTSNTYTTATAGTVTAYVKDANNCQIGPLSIVIAAPEQFTSITITDSGWDCATTPAGGHVNIAGIGVSSPKRYSIISGPAGFDSTENSDGEFKGLAPGAYVFQARDTKTNCTITRSYTVSGTPDVVAGGSVISPIKCFGGNGNIQFTVSGLNTHRYDYVVTNTLGTIIDSKNNQSAPTISLNNLPASSYTIVITDRTTKCTDDYTLTLTQPTAALAITSATGTNVNCNNDNSQITVVAANGTPNYMYAVLPAGSLAAPTFVTNNVLTVDTNSGTVLSWDVYVKDANDCTTKTTVTVISDALPAITSVVVGGQCTASGSTFTITATPSAASLTPLTYGIAGPTGAFQASPIFNVAAGTYTVYIKDKNGCIVAAPAPTTVYPQLAVLAQVTKTLDCNTAGPNATITATITGGKANYSYSITNSGGTSVASATGVTGPTITYTGAAADTYTVTVTDANTPGCTATSTATVDPITNPTVSATPTHVTCNGGNNGAVQLAGSGGSGGYTYSDDNITFVPTSLFSGLTASATPYTFYVKDSKGCIGSIAVTITEPTALAATVTEVTFTCSPTNTKVAGTVTINTTAGTGTSPYKYSFNGGAFGNNNLFTVNDNGSDQPYTYSVQDANGCTISGLGTLFRLNPPTIATITNTPIYCAPVASTTSTVTVPVTAGTGVAPLTYVITSGPVINATGVSSGVFSGLTAGNYTFKVTDANGCYYTESHTIAPVTPIAVTATKLSDVDCKNDTTGSARFTVTGFSSSLNYTVVTSPVIPPAQIAIAGDVYTITGLADGTYSFSVTDITTGCTDSKSVTIIEPTAALTITSATATNVFCSNDNSQITVTATGGTTNYGYAAVVSGDPVPTVFGTSNVITVDTNTGANLVWDVYVKDAKGCIAQTPVTIINNGSPTVTASVFNQCSATGSAFQIIAVGAGGLAPYTYTINTGVAPSPANTFTVAAGSYTITATDANGCLTTTTVTVNQALTATALVTKDITCSTSEEATMKVDVLGGLAPFGYRVNIDGAGFSGAVIPFPIAGTTLNYTDTGIVIGKSYQFEITDANGCIRVTNTVNTNTPTPVTATTTVTDLTCYQSGNGVVTINPTAGVAPFEYSFNGSGFSAVSSYSNLAVSTGPGYPYIVRDSKGCEFPGFAIVNQPTEILFTATPVNMTCSAAIIAGSVTVSAITNGVAPFNYLLRNLTTGAVITHPDPTGASFTFANLSFGNFEVIVTDATGCSKTVSNIQVLAPPDDLVINLSTTADCTNGATIIVSVNPIVIPPIPDYEFGIYDLAVAPFSTSFLAPDGAASPANRQRTFTNLIPGVVYTFVVRDNITGCYYFEKASGPIPPLTGMTSSAPVANNVTCTGTATGSVTFTLSNYDATSVNWEIFSDQTNISTGISGSIVTAAPTTVTTPPGLIPGNYYVKFTEVGGSFPGCTSASTIFSIIESPVLLDLSVSSTRNDNCNANAGQVIAIRSGGTGPFLYQIVADNGVIGIDAADTQPTIISFVSPTHIPSTFNVESGNYIVWVKDSRDCIIGKPVTVLLDQSPKIGLAVVNKCVTEGNFGIIVSAVPTVTPPETGMGTGALSISIDGSTYTNLPLPYLPYTVTGLNSGLHTIIIKDANGCTYTETITIDVPLVATPAITALPTCADNDGVITMSGTGGPVAGTYTYTIAPTFPSVAINNTTGVISGLPAGTYTVTMTDTAIPTNCTTTAVVTLGAPTPVTYNTATTPALCVGDSNGSITVTLLAGNDNPSYTYEIIAGPQLAVAQSSNIFLGLLPGTYTVRVNSGRGCSTDDTNVIVAPATPLTASAAFPANTTCNTATVVTVTAGGGTGSGYLYNFNGLGYTSDPTYTVDDNGSVQTISYRVKDANGCETALQTIDVDPLNKPTDLDFTLSTAPTCPVPTSGITVSATNGVGALTFEIVQFNGAATALYPPQITTGFAVPTVFNNLPAGDYMFQVTDSFGCTYQESYTVTPVTNITLATTAKTDVTCFGANDGSATFKVTDFTSYTASLTVGTGTPVITADIVTLTGLAPGNYTLQVTDATTDCTADVSFVIAEPTALGLTLVSNLNANCNSGAVVKVQGTGGTLNYTYAFVDNGITPLAIDYTASDNGTLAVTLPSPNDYDVWVKDANGCTFKLDVSVAFDATPTIVPPVGQCYVGTALTTDLDLVTTTFNGNKAYTVNGTAIATSIATFTVPGTYILGIKDDNGCAAFVNYTIQPQLTLQADMTQDLTCAINASVTLTAAGGETPYVSYEVNDGTGYVASANPFITNTAGTYKFRVTDTQGCQAESQDVIVTPNTTPAALTAPTMVSCIGDTDGTITLTPSGGIIPYQYSIDGGTTYQDSNVFDGLGIGTYTILVRDAKMCISAPISETIGQPTAVTVIAEVVTPFGCDTANAPQDAIVTITAGGGTPGYTYSFDNGTNWQASSSFSVNSAQTINYVVRDANGCSVSGSAVVDPYSPPTDMDITASPIYCNTPGTVATVTVNSVSGGVSPYVFEIISPALAATVPSAPSAVPFSFANLAPATYTIKVTDANGCSTIKSIIVEEADKIAVIPQLINNVYCNGDSTGVIEFTVSNYITAGNYSYNLLPVPTVPPTVTGDVIRYTDLSAGSYTFTVTDDVSDCIATITNFVVSQPALALDFNTTATNINCNNDNATITVAAFGGTADYKYAVVPTTAIAPVVSAYGLGNLLTVDTNSGANMTWDVYVMDANGCVTFKSVTILTDANPVITSAIHTPCVSATGTYDITVTASGFSTALQYSADGSNYQTGNVIKVNAPGTYNITVKDANGCISAGTSVTILDPLILTPTVTTPVSCATNDGVVSVSTTGGSGNYIYNIDGGAFALVASFPNVASGSHIIGVRDTTTLCEVFATVNLQAATLITGFALAKTDVTCNGGTDGTIIATMATPAPGINDNPVYMYSLNGGTPQASNLFSGLSAGTYTVVVTSERNCIDSETITVAEPALINVPAPTLVPFGCTSGNVSNLATITVVGVTGGSNSYLNYEFIKVGTPNTQVQFGSSNVYTEANLTGGSYIVNVYDSKNCIGTSTAPITIAPYIALDKVDVTVNQAITCNNLENITVTAITIGGPATNLQFTVQDVTYDNSTTPPTANLGVGYNLAPTSVVGNTATFIDLPIGNYLITVRNLDTQCEIQGVHYVNEPNTFDLTIDNVVDVTCFGGTNGSANVTLIDRVITANSPNQAGPFSYTLVDALGVSLPSGTSTAAGTVALTNLAAGTYTITATLTNTPYCVVSKNFTVNGPTAALTLGETHTAITCVTGNNDGTISATATGGWPGGYEFQLLKGATEVQAYGANNNWSNLTADTYTINVRDSKGCVAPQTVVLSNPLPITFTAVPSISMLACKGDTSATITVSAPTGGQGSNYLFTLNTTSASPIISNGPQAGNVFANLGAGTYTVTVTDGWGCGTTSAPITIAEPTIVSASLVVASTQTCLTQTALTLSAAGGTAPYTYSTTPNFVSSIAMVGNSATFQVPVGTYRYYVRDVNGCTSIVSNDIKIDALVPLTINLDVTNSVINCKDDATGVIVAVANGGLGNYVYTLLDDATNLPIAGAVQTTPGNFTQLVAGNYKVNVVSGDCNTTTSVIQINEPILPLIAPVVVTPVSCNGNGDGKIEINASGGTGIIKYAISPNLNQFFVSGTFINLKPGVYDIITQDQNGCFILDQHTIVEPTSIVANVVPGSIQQELCAGEKTGEFAITITGGTAPYSTSIDNPNGVYVPNQLLFTGLSGGNHTVYIQDANTCTFEMEVALDAAVTLNPIATVSNECVNDLPANKVTVTIDPSNVSTDVKYSLDSTGVEQDSNVFTNLTPGDHFIMVHHKNGCIDATDTFTIDRIDPLTISIDLGGLNEIVATVTGGSGVYRYSVNGQDIGSDNKYIYFRSGDYTVTVTDSNGCSVSATKYFEFIDIKIPNVFTPNGSGTNDSWKPTNTENYPNIKFVVYDRYGREVGTFGAGQFWDGKYNGTELPMGDYWYVLKLKHNQDEREFVGHFTLYR
ncbi:T9SS type B sorting domain-containing protein [Flavobacterium sp. A45]|uniref:T9SS type B sorting domain-containing protein n=1 Tax=Flavobacterium sp. A45 TaxID=1945862 RepID=UPI0013F63E3B|nr:T9SS type B sorting domain-containing protein [Flavobacterium sp. A45]